MNAIGNLALANWDRWLDNYNARYQAAFCPKMRENLVGFYQLAVSVRERGAKLIFAGNGASASLSSHARVDFAKHGKVRTIDFNEPNLITAYSNDYGFENWLARALQTFADPGDACVFVSVSGTSPNIVAAAEYAKSQGMRIVTFTSKEADNPLKMLGDINFWIESDAYNVVETVHTMWMMTVCDMLIGDAEYSVS